MKARPIPFSGPMIRALLEGRKTQTRRVAKPRRAPSFLDGSWSDSYVLDPGNREWLMRDCPYGKPGDLLWAREAWRIAERYDDKSGAELSGTLSARNVQYAVQADQFLGKVRGRHRHARFMPRWASRLTLRITDVRVQRLKEISPQDAIAEAIEIGDWADIEHDTRHGISVVDHYRDLWESIHGPGSWDENPWVWALSFEVIKANVDDVLRGEA